MAQFTIISGPERRRRWNLDQKRAVVQASLAPGASIAAIAREADLSPALIYRWRRELTGSCVSRPNGFAAVAVLPDAVGREPAGAMQISIGGATLRVPNGTSTSLLIAALGALRA